MVLAMTRPTRRTESSVFQFTKRVPKVVLAKNKGAKLTLTLAAAEGHAEKLLHAKIGAVVKISLHTREPSLAKARAGAVEEQLQAVWSAMKAGPRPLSHKQIVALAGELYTAFAEAFEDDPGPRSRWSKVLQADADALAGNWGIASLVGIHKNEATRIHYALDSRFGGFADAILAKHHLITDEPSRSKLLLEVARQLNAAARKAKANSEGDYAPDPHALSVPKWSKHDGKLDVASASHSIMGVFEEWRERVVKSKGLVKSTVDGYRHVFKIFVAFLGHDEFSQLTDESVIRFAEQRVADGINPRTVNDGDISALKAVFAWAVKTKRIKFNPAAGIRVPEGKKARLREKGYNDAEALSILRAARAYKQTSAESVEVAAAKRWAPWLLAFSGARIGEIVQLRRKDIAQENDHWTMTITPEAGSVKGKEVRKVPLHPQLIELGFIEFVEASGATLFRKQKSGGMPLKRGGVSNRVREFVRSVASDRNVQPNHGWRHRFITQCRLHKLDQELRRMMTGHVGKGVDETTYGDAAGLYEEICKLPHFNVNSP